jgi:hypothetical protein
MALILEISCNLKPFQKPHTIGLSVIASEAKAIQLFTSDSLDADGAEA